VDAELVTYRHPELHFSIDLPPEIEIGDDIPHVAVVAVERADVVPPGSFRANLNVVVEQGPPGMDLDGYVEANGHVAIGAMTREYVAEESGTVADTLPLLAAALPLIGHEAIRSRGTIGGSLAHADPAAELPAVARALDAEFVVRGPSGTRVIPAAQWFDGYLTTSRRPDELLAEVRFPAARPGTGVSFEEVARRHGDFAIVGLAASLVLSGGVISDARLAFAGVSDVPVRATAAEDLLAGERPSAELFDEAARRATEDLDPPADLHGSSDYRKTVAAAVVRRGLRAAADNAARGSN